MEIREKFLCLFALDVGKGGDDRIPESLEDSARGSAHELRSRTKEKSADSDRHHREEEEGKSKRLQDEHSTPTHPRVVEHGRKECDSYPKKGIGAEHKEQSPETHDSPLAELVSERSFLPLRREIRLRCEKRLDLIHR